MRRKSFINPRDGRVTVAVWASGWIESIDVGPLSDVEYRRRLKNQILPQWGSVPVGDISPTAVAAWEKALLRGRISKNYADGVVGIFRTMMDDAVSEGLRGDNPVAARKSGRRGRFQSQRPEKKIIATPRQALLVARNALEMRVLNEYAIVLTSAYTGLRIGELAAVHRDQLALKDEKHGPRVHAIQQSHYVGGVFTEIQPKYDSGRGLIIPQFLAEVLQELVDSRPSEWVFTAPKGGRMIRGGDWYAETWRPIVHGRAPRGVVRGARARTGIRPVLGVEGMVPHGLRHSHKVWLDEGGHPRVAVEARMGHVLQGVEGVYSHVTLPMELRIADQLQGLWEGSLRPVLDRREYGPFPEFTSPRCKRSPKNLPQAV
ncbi:tyrosine-type recombinase/integrase [Streptomyces sp. NPDC059101]|uniref:tyrosine-type recombinase/integrase n=1 Tax=Streptomyces sp. NPDC059101 TaxID=3346728 RepID=UPI0036ACD3CF